MKIRFTPHEVTVARRGKWRKWFAWYPVWLDANTLVWMQWVKRKDEYDYSSGWWKIIRDIDYQEEEK